MKPSLLQHHGSRLRSRIVARSFSGDGVCGEAYGGDGVSYEAAGGDGVSGHPSKRKLQHVVAICLGDEVDDK